MIEETVISKAIIESYLHDLLDSVESDIIVGGGGPSGLCAAYYLARKGYKVVLFERALKLGGGMPGGGIMFNRIVVQEQARDLLAEFNIRCNEYQDGYFVANSLEATAALTDKALKAGTRIFNLITIEDVIVRDQRVSGAVINWSSAEIAKLHIDPISFKSKVVVDATGHPCAERFAVDNTKEALPGLYVCGMASNAVFGGPRMGPIFGGMLLSGKKVAELIMNEQ
jgi:thiazole biosynthesis enzyme